MTTWLVVESVNDPEDDVPWVIVRSMHNTCAEANMHAHNVHMRSVPLDKAALLELKAAGYPVAIAILLGVMKETEITSNDLDTDVVIAIGNEIPDVWCNRDMVQS